MISKLIRGGARLLSYVAALCLFLMMTQIVLDVVMKYVFNAPIEGNLEVVSFYYMVAVVFLPLAMVELRHEHINVDLFYQMAPHGVQKYLYAFSSLLTSTFFAVLTYQTFIDAVKSTVAGEVMMGTNLVSIWPSRWALPIGMGMVCLATLHHAVRAVLERQFDPRPSSPELQA